MQVLALWKKKASEVVVAVIHSHGKRVSHMLHHLELKTLQPHKWLMGEVKINKNTSGSAKNGMMCPFHFSYKVSIREQYKMPPCPINSGAEPDIHGNSMYVRLYTYGRYCLPPHLLGGAIYKYNYCFTHLIPAQYRAVSTLKQEMTLHHSLYTPNQH